MSFSFLLYNKLMATGLLDPSSKEPNTLMATQPLTSAISFPDESYLVILWRWIKQGLIFNFLIKQGLIQGLIKAS